MVICYSRFRKLIHVDHVCQDWVTNPFLNKSLERRMDYDHWFDLVICGGKNCGDAITRTITVSHCLLLPAPYHPHTQLLSSIDCALSISLLYGCLSFYFICYILTRKSTHVSKFKILQNKIENYKHPPRSSLSSMPHSFCSTTTPNLVSHVY